MNLTRSRIKAIDKELRNLGDANTLNEDDLLDLTSWRNSMVPV